MEPVGTQGTPVGLVEPGTTDSYVKSHTSRLGTSCPRVLGIESRDRGQTSMNSVRGTGGTEVDIPRATVQKEVGCDGTADTPG